MFHALYVRVLILLFSIEIFWYQLIWVNKKKVLFWSSSCLEFEKKQNQMFFSWNCHSWHVGILMMKSTFACYLCLFNRLLWKQNRARLTSLLHHQVKESVYWKKKKCVVTHTNRSSLVLLVLIVMHSTVSIIVILTLFQLAAEKQNLKHRGKWFCQQTNP